MLEECAGHIDMVKNGEATLEEFAKLYCMEPAHAD